MNAAARLAHAPCRVLVVDDDAVYRLAITRTLDGIDGVELAGTVGTLAQARAKIERGPVDLVLLDVVLRGESGLELLRWIQREHQAIQVVLLTAGGDPTVRAPVDAALLGAAALLLKPMGPGAPEVLAQTLRSLFAALRDGGLGTPRPRPARAVEPARIIAPAAREVVAIGASTGGPPVLAQLLGALPVGFPVPVVITQHMPADHIRYFVEMLARHSRRTVTAAADGMALAPRTTYVAPGGTHLTIARTPSGLAARLEDGPEEHNCRPAVDPLFRSVAATCGAAAVGVVISGMGSDGATGAVALRRAGAPVVVQDRATSVVWGMPGAAVATGGADVVAPAGELVRWILEWTKWSDNG